VTQVGVVSQFTDVDLSADAGWFVTFMDTVNALPDYVVIADRGPGTRSRRGGA
jgi:hypothetical protein